MESERDLKKILEEAKDLASQGKKEDSGIKLKDIREYLGLRVKDLAQKLDVDRLTISRYEKGEVKIPAHRLKSYERLIYGDVTINNDIRNSPIGPYIQIILNKYGESGEFIEGELERLVHRLTAPNED